jgi:hypothetical protein
MTYFIAGNTAVENARAVAQSALPDAPVEEYFEPAPRRSYAVRARLSSVLRAAAAQELKLADRIAPQSHCETAAG